MKSKLKLLLKELIEEQGIQILFFDSSFDNIALYDYGLRSQLYEDFDYKNLARTLIDLDDYVIYRLHDQYHVRYYFWKMPVEDSQSAEMEICMIGPLGLQGDTMEPHLIAEQNHLPLNAIGELQEFYNGIPLFQDFNLIESEIFVFARYLFDDHPYQINDSHMFGFYEGLTVTSNIKSETDLLSVSFIEERYRYEDTLLHAISRGDYTKALEQIHLFARFHMPERTNDSLRNKKNTLIILNTLFRKAVQYAKVHPAHIDTVSDSFARRIEAARSIDLIHINHDMVRKYCHLVTNHSLKNYSHVIEDSINYIDFHIAEALSLKILAEQVSVNPSYLSAQFKKETGKTITDYINERRIGDSLILLTTTDLQIQTIAERVGIDDENYFSRLFKKIFNQTPREYRKNMKS